MDGCVLRAINIRQISPSDRNTSVYHIFERLNTGGTPLKPQEIRNCVFAGEFVVILKELNKDGHRLILWTYRNGSRLDEAVEFCSKKGVEFYAVNKNYPEEKFEGKVSRKIHADIFIDDRNIGGLLGWGEVYKLITNNPDAKLPLRKKKKWYLPFL